MVALDIGFPESESLTIPSRKAALSYSGLSIKSCPSPLGPLLISVDNTSPEGK